MMSIVISGRVSSSRWTRERLSSEGNEGTVRPEDIIDRKKKFEENAVFYQPK